MTAASGLPVRLPTAAKRSGMRPSSASALGRPSAHASPTLARRRSMPGLASIHSRTDVPPTPLPARIDWSTGFVSQPARSGAFSAMRFSTSAGSGGTLNPTSSHNSPPPPPAWARRRPRLGESPWKGPRPHVGEGEEHIDQLLDGVYRYGAGLGQGGVPDVSLPRQRRRVRGGGA